MLIYLDIAYLHLSLFINYQYFVYSWELGVPLTFYNWISVFILNLKFKNKIMFPRGLKLYSLFYVEECFFRGGILVPVLKKWNKYQNA